MTIPNSLKTQVGGSHYKKPRYQPLEFAEAYNRSVVLKDKFDYDDYLKI